MGILPSFSEGLPMAVLSVAGGHLRLPRQQRTLLAQTYLPWALRAGSQCEPLMAIHYEAHFQARSPLAPCGSPRVLVKMLCPQEDLKELRRRWKIAAAPKTDAMKGV